MKFKSKMELAQALIEGRTFTFNHGGTVYFDAEKMRFMFNKSSYDCKKDTEVRELWEQYSYDIWTETTPKPWYEELYGQPVLCKVKDEEHKQSEFLVFITTYKATNPLPFRDHLNNNWLNATPLTDEEIDAYKIGYERTA